MCTGLRPYTLRPLKIGCEALGINLGQDLKEEVIQQIKEDVRNHRIIVFRDQENITPEKHLEIGGWFGEIDSTFYNHPRSPHPDIFRVSNDSVEGCTNVGRRGWHIDGSFQEEPFSHSLYHIISVPQAGTTSFISLTEMIQGLDDEKRKFWDSLWMISDSRDIIHPLIYSHPETKKPVLCFHLGMTGGFIQNYGSLTQKNLSSAESEQILDQIHEEIMKNTDLMYHHKYLQGDFIISDNLAVGHEASPDTQLPRSQIGLRVMHRVTIAGKQPPKK